MCCRIQKHRYDFGGKSRFTVLEENLDFTVLAKNLDFTVLTEN